MHCTSEHKSLPKVASYKIVFYYGKTFTNLYMLMFLQDLEDFIEESEDEGFVFISLGSLVKMSSVPEPLVQPHNL